ncbi:hypothetical protein GQ597_04145 [Gilliamella sp. Pra-s65]|uniref:hypothetical protein n=1 Tax=unclassified Gilliamella TaxID=2685620 RepID=UPI001366269F|nr:MULTISPECIES: hypothetical protein [unclassified Gilliamella]MWN89900.1 hypothetical protein [Gilliamella sp. Pra-s65]MWP46040.1 hypothetical protein [Gilliamella sp. Pas-s27]MWP73072.1 hypothetical protein [Gilliamella sp. Pra-s52]
MRTLLLIVTLLVCPLLYANPAPFGLEINKATLEKTKEKYNLVENGVNYYSQGSTYLIDTKELSLDGLNRVLLIFSKENNILLSVVATFSSYKFDSINNNLFQKYKLLKQSIPLVGDRHVEYKDDQSLIILDAPHSSFDLHITYISEEFNKKVNEIRKFDKEQNKNEFNSL